MATLIAEHRHDDAPPSLTGTTCNVKVPGRWAPKEAGAPTEMEWIETHPCGGVLRAVDGGAECPFCGTFEADRRPTLEQLYRQDKSGRWQLIVLPARKMTETGLRCEAATNHYLTPEVALAWLTEHGRADLAIEFFPGAPS